MKNVKPLNRFGKKMPPHTDLTTGFTLVELLIVIAIIAVLASVLFPTILFVRENGRRTACLSNERQLGLALLQYASDHDESWPSGSTSIGSSSPGAGWGGQCYPYVRSAEVFRCPDDAAPSNLTAGEVTVSYGYNTNLSRSSRTRQLTYAPAPAKTVLLFEVGHNAASLASSVAETFSAAGNGSWNQGPSEKPEGDTFPYGSSSDNAYPIYATGAMGGRILNGGGSSTPRHRGGADYLACDGHVGWFRPSEVSCGGTTASPDAPQDTVGAAGTGNSKYKLTFSVR